jgi:uncharacterized protein YndB with AHSA1/START domain
MMKVDERIVIDVAPEVVFAYVTDPAKMAEWLPSMVETRNIVGTGEGQQYEWTYKMVGILFRGQTVVVEHVPNRLAVLQTIGAADSTWTFDVEPTDGGTTLRLTIEYEVPVPVLGKLAERIISKRDARTIRLGLANAKDTLEG